jgi:hypothetical protein
MLGAYLKTIETVDIDRRLRDLEKVTVRRVGRIEMLRGSAPEPPPV